MTEKEKMLSGMLYYSYDEELFHDNQYVKELIFDFNSLRPSELERRKEIIRMLFNKIGSNFFIEAPFRCDYGYNISIGKNFYANYNCLILDCAQVTIGNNVLFAPNVSLLTAAHPIDSKLRNQDLEYALPITIGNSVWLGGGVIINPGVTIGDNVVIGSGSVVTKDIPANCVAVGNPAKVIRTITNEDKQNLIKWKE
jgi:maltose O-acetyltransferase